MKYLQFIINDIGIINDDNGNFSLNISVKDDKIYTESNIFSSLDIKASKELSQSIYKIILDWTMDKTFRELYQFAKDEKEIKIEYE